MRALRAGQRQRAGPELGPQLPLDLADAVAQPAGQGRHAAAVHDPVGDQAHGPRDKVGPHVPFGRSGAGVGPAALAGPEARLLRRRGAGVKAHVLRLRRYHRAARPAVDAGSPDRGEEPAVKSRVLGLDRPDASFPVFVHASSLVDRGRHPIARMRHSAVGAPGRADDVAKSLAPSGGAARLAPGRAGAVRHPDTPGTRLSPRRSARGGQTTLAEVPGAAKSAPRAGTPVPAPSARDQALAFLVRQASDAAASNNLERSDELIRQVLAAEQEPASRSSHDVRMDLLRVAISVLHDPGSVCHHRHRRLPSELQARRPMSR